VNLDLVTRQEMEAYVRKAISELRRGSVEEDALWSVREVAEYLGRTTTTVRKMLERGKGPQAGRLGGKWVCRAGDVKAWAHAQAGL